MTNVSFFAIDFEEMNNVREEAEITLTLTEEMMSALDGGLSCAQR